MKKRNIVVLLAIFSLGLFACAEKEPETPTDPDDHGGEVTPPDDGGEVTPPDDGGNTPQTVYHTVTFSVHGQVVQTSQVEHGKEAIYEGDMPTKDPDGEAFKYVFQGWDKSRLNITEDTQFNAVFLPYTHETVIDDFENYDVSAEIIDAGWEAQAYEGNKWVKASNITVSLGQKSDEGNKSLRFDSVGNGYGYKFVKFINKDSYKFAANCIKFRLMAPMFETLKVLVVVDVDIGGTLTEIPFTYTIGQLKSGEYTEYVIPFIAPDWHAWQNLESIAELATWANMHPDALPRFLKRIEFYLEGNDGVGGKKFISFLDSVRFVTLDDPAYSEVETMGSYSVFTGKTANGNNVKFVNNGDGTGTMTILDTATPTVVEGQLNTNNKNFVFVSSDSGQTYQYLGKQINGGQSVKYSTSRGTLVNTLGELNFTAVQTVDNYEQYTEDGVAYYEGNKNKNNRSGCRGAYYSEYYKGSGSSEWGGDKWHILEGEGDQLRLVNDPTFAHSGNNCLRLKAAKDNALRYMQWGLFDGSSENNNFRGATLSFWAKTSGRVPAFTVSAYAQTAPRNATKDKYVKSIQVKSDAEISEWTHYEIELQPVYVYYGFLVFMDHNDIADAALFIDDVEIYTGNPYATYHA